MKTEDELPMKFKMIEEILKEWSHLNLINLIDLFSNQGYAIPIFKLLHTSMTSISSCRFPNPSRTLCQKLFQLPQLQKPLHNF